MRDKISFPDYQREPRLWKTESKQLLIDSIIRDVDIPKLYFNLAEKDSYEVVDGQQRLWAVWEFVDDKFPVGEGEYAGKFFSELPKDIKSRIADYRFQITVLSNVSNDDLRLLFLRLQFGLLLITGEKLHAATGAMKKYTFETMAAHPWIEALRMSARRFAKETLCAQFCINVVSRKRTGMFSRTRYEDLDVFFNEFAKPVGQDKVLFLEMTKEISSLLDRLEADFGEATTDLKNRSYILSILLLAHDLNSGKKLKPADVRLLADFSSHMWRRLKEEVEAGIQRQNETLFEFESQLSSAPGEKYQIERRHATLLKCFDSFSKKRKLPGD
jgi:hypothetical protein